MEGGIPGYVLMEGEIPGYVLMEGEIPGYVLMERRIPGCDLIGEGNTRRSLERQKNDFSHSYGAQAQT
jgi:hypothetical protein